MATVEKELFSGKQHEPGATPFRFTREQYYCMAELGWFDGSRVQLVEGDIYFMSPMSDDHGGAILIISELLRTAFAHDFVIAVQLPIVVGRIASRSRILRFFPVRLGTTLIRSRLRLRWWSRFRYRRSNWIGSRRERTLALGLASIGLWIWSRA